MPPQTYPPRKLTALPITPETLSAEIKSTNILRTRLDELSGSIESGLADEAKEELRRYEVWIRDVGNGGSVNTESGETTSCEDEERSSLVNESTREVLNIIDEIKFRRKYITNQLKLLNLQKSQEKSKASQSRISKLQKYNEIKDIAQELMGLVADNRNITVKTLYESGEFGVDVDD